MQMSSSLSREFSVYQQPLRNCQFVPTSFLWEWKKNIFLLISPADKEVEQWFKLIVLRIYQETNILFFQVTLQDPGALDKVWLIDAGNLVKNRSD